MGFQIPLKGLMFNLPIGTVFSREARIFMNDIRILRVVVKLVCKSLDCTCQNTPLFSVVNTLPMSNLQPRKSKHCVGTTSDLLKFITNLVPEQTLLVDSTAPSKFVVMEPRVTSRLDIGVCEFPCYAAQVLPLLLCG